MISLDYLDVITSVKEGNVYPLPESWSLAKATRYFRTLVELNPEETGNNDHEKHFALFSESFESPIIGKQSHYVIALCDKHGKMCGAGAGNEKK